MPVRRLAWGLLSVLVWVSPVARAQDATLPAAVRAAADGITAAGLTRDLDYFASDALRGRDTASPGFDAAATYIEARLTFNRRDDRPESEFFYPRTDAGPYLERGILTVGFTTGSHPRYHLPTDEARYLDPAKLETVARTVFASVWALADTPERPRIEREIPASVPRYGKGRTN